jgi:hypothetical protein
LRYKVDFVELADHIEGNDEDEFMSDDDVRFSLPSLLSLRSPRPPGKQC